MAVSTEPQTFWDHLEELRKSIFHVLAVFVSLAVVMFFFKNFLFDKVVLAPASSDFFLYRMLGVDFSLSLVNLEVSAQFLIHMKVTFLCALVLAVPYLIYEIWKFVLPALYENEKRAVRGALGFASVLFYIGLAVAYSVIFPFMLNFFASYQVSPDVPNNFSLSSYISMFVSTRLAFGIVFEFPAVIAALSRLGVVSRSLLKQYRKHAFVVILVLSAVITPSGDPFTMMVVCLPLYLLYELSILICKDKPVEMIEE
jgi:sec-independent protein translocase protein TatC